MAKLKELPKLLGVFLSAQFMASFCFNGVAFADVTKSARQYELDEKSFACLRGLVPELAASTKPFLVLVPELCPKIEISGEDLKKLQVNSLPEVKVASGKARAILLSKAEIACFAKAPEKFLLASKSSDGVMKYVLQIEAC
jgi:hypothetical protein